MEFVAIFILGFFVLTVVFGPLLGAESRPDFLQPNRKARKMTTPLRAADRPKH